MPNPRRKFSLHIENISSRLNQRNVPSVLCPFRFMSFLGCVLLGSSSCLRIDWFGQLQPNWTVKLQQDHCRTNQYPFDMYSLSCMFSCTQWECIWFSTSERRIGEDWYASESWNFCTDSLPGIKEVFQKMTDNYSDKIEETKEK